MRDKLLAGHYLRFGLMGYGFDDSHDPVRRSR